MEVSWPEISLYVSCDMFSSFEKYFIGWLIKMSGLQNAAKVAEWIDLLNEVFSVVYLNNNVYQIYMLIIFTKLLLLTISNNYCQLPLKVCS